jgi:hypothetical protein
MRIASALGLLAVLSCTETSLSGGIPPADSGFQDDSGGTGSGDASAGADNRLSGNCINERFDAGAQSCRSTLPLPCQPCINCAPLRAGNDGGCAAPDISIFGWHGGGVDTSLRYPVGCVVYLPTENPHYPGGAQECSCSAEIGFPTWECPI